MWKLLAYCGVVGHALAGTWPMFGAVGPAEPVCWLALTVQMLGPGLLEVAIAVLVVAASTPKEAVLSFESMGS
jgi:hypothetical protein